MGKKKGNKRKKSDDSVDNGHDNKAGRYTRSPEGVSVSSLLSQTNSVLFDDGDEKIDLQCLFNNSSDSNSDCNSSLISSDCDNSVISVDKDMATPNPTHRSQNPNNIRSDNKKQQHQHSPTNADIMNCLKNLESKFTDIDKRLGKLESLDKKIDKFEIEMKKLWTHIGDQNRKIDERIIRVEEKADATDFSLGLVNDKVISLERERNSLKEEVVYLQSQSMRNNLIFGNIAEADREDTETIVRGFLEEKMKIAKATVDEMQFERVHRMGPRQAGNRPRKIVAKFNLFKEREYVRKQSKTLKGTDYFVHEQFPKEVNDKRRQLMPQLKEARRAGKPAWLAYDTLYVDGKPVNRDR